MMRDRPTGDTPQAEASAAWLAAMRQGQWSKAWRQTDRIELSRRAAQQREGFTRQPHHLLWDGTSFEQRSVLVRCEHGLGDTLQFIRFVPAISHLAREVNLLVQPQLLTLLAEAPGLGAVRSAWSDAPPPAHDVQIEVMELAYAFRTTPSTVPAPYPHLNARIAGRFTLPRAEDRRLRVALLWAASDWDESRSIPLALLEPLLGLPQAQFLSLQQGELAADPAIERLPIIPLSQQTRDIADAASAMLQMDLVISVDGMAAHLAATLGRPTWLLLKHDADWRWMQGRGDTPWYPTMRLLRQRRPGDWGSVVKAAARALSTFG